MKVFLGGMIKMKKFLAMLMIAALLSASVIAVSAYTDDYPASSKSENIAAPTDGAIMIGELIGTDVGWTDDGSGNPDTGRHAAFDGYLDTFYDPQNFNDPEWYCGVKMPEAYILTEIRLIPRSDQLGRFLGAAIWGFNGDTFDPNTATLIWESGSAADEQVFFCIKANEFIPGSNTGFTHFAYFNEQQHGDVVEVELYGNPVAPRTPADDAKDEAPAPAQTAAAPAPRTSDTRVFTGFALLAAVTTAAGKFARQKNIAQFIDI
jgi:hypothetical protein